MSDSLKEISGMTFTNREYSLRHSPPEREYEFYDAVKNGDTERVKKVMTPLGSGDSGMISENPLQNIKYHFTVTVALITRFCVEGGMERETAYTMSDFYICKADKCTSEEQLSKLHLEAVMDYTERMKKTVRGDACSKPVTTAMDYIYNNLHSKILEEDIAKAVNLSASYLSHIFREEVGVTIRAYISMKRVEEARNMLRFSDFQPLDIGNYLGFSSHSHFISTFKKYTGMTPGEYRRKYFRSNWERAK